MANKPKRGPGAPPAEISAEFVLRSASIGCTVEEIAALLGVGERTLQDRMVRDPAIKAAIDAGRAQGRATLRRLQWQGAQAGNPTMLIWLGKQMLGQRDMASMNVAVTPEDLKRAADMARSEASRRGFDGEAAGRHDPGALPN